MSIKYFSGISKQNDSNGLSDKYKECSAAVRAVVSSFPKPPSPIKHEFYALFAYDTVAAAANLKTCRNGLSYEQ